MSFTSGRAERNENIQSMRGQLCFDHVNVNEQSTVGAILKTCMLEFRRSSNWHALTVHATDHFRTVGSQPPAAPGWYVIVDLAGRPLYVGQAEDLNSRLNSTTGSLDNFNNSNRRSDPTRNFLKTLVSAGMLDGLRVAVIEETTVRAELELGDPLTNLDRGNIEKLLGIFRVGLVPESADAVR